MRKIISAIVFSLAAVISVTAQIIDEKNRPEINTDSIRRAFDSGPFFSLYKDNYFIFGPAVNHGINKHNTNVKFQISLQVKLTKSVLPWHTYLYLYYTQKCIWNVLENSLPMRDLNFNPGIGLAKPFFHDNRYIGKAFLVFEHESNGRDSIWSRSWNRISMGANVILSNNVMIHGKFWIPFVDGQYNRDLLKYAGIFQSGAEYISNNRRWRASAVIVKRSGWNLNANVIAEVSYNIFKDAEWSLFAQFYNGYGENLLDYNCFRSQLRIGIVFRPTLFSDY